MMQTTQTIAQKLKDKYKAQEFVNGTVELVGESFLADAPTILDRPLNEEYVRRELKWYLSQSLNIYDIEGSTPAAWIRSASPAGHINSNYGYLIWSGKNYSQYDNVLQELKRNPSSRRACMIYTRPEIWVDYNRDGKNDFICTFAVTYLIRNGKLNAHVVMRSCDVIFGYPNDKAWQDYVHGALALELDLEVGDMIWTASSLHVYEPFYKYLHE